MTAPEGLPPAWLEELVLRAEGPPWLAMGLGRVDESAWLLPDEHRDAELAERRRLLAERHHEVFGALPGTEAAGAEVLGAFDAMVQYSKGYDDVSFGSATPGDNRRAQVVDAGVRYANGPLSFVLAYDQKNGGSTLPKAAMTPKVGGYEGNIDRRIAAAVQYSLQSVDLYVGYRYLNAKAIHLSALNKSPVEASSYYWLGTTWHAMPALDLSATAMYQDFYGTNRDPLSFQVSADYNFSKRTDVYVNLGYVVNRNGSDLGLNGFGSNVVAGKNQFGTMAGIKHTF